VLHATVGAIAAVDIMAVDIMAVDITAVDIMAVDITAVDIMAGVGTIRIPIGIMASTTRTVTGY
jgi:hypothetical protein